jgi:tRNA (adenine-N(1)-)-methyltransferase non-catalytic subunit
LPEEKIRSKDYKEYQKIMSFSSLFLTVTCMDILPLPSTSTSVSGNEETSSKIQSGHNVLVRQPNGDVRGIKLARDSCVFSTVQSICSTQQNISDLCPRTVAVGRIGSFYANELIGQPYGFSYEMIDKKLKILPVRTLEEVGMDNISNLFLILAK